MTPAQAAETLADEVKATMELRYLARSNVPDALKPTMVAIRAAMEQLSHELSNHLTMLPGGTSCEVYGDQSVIFKWDHQDYGNVGIEFYSSQRWGIAYQLGREDPHELVADFDHSGVRDRVVEQAVAVVINALRKAILPRL